MNEDANPQKEGLGSGPTEEFRISGEELVAKVKELIKAGNARSITIKKPASTRDASSTRGGPDGTTVMQIPVTAGVVLTALMPALVAVGAIAALAVEWIITVEYKEQ